MWNDSHWTAQCASSTIIWLMLLTKLSFVQRVLRRFPQSRLGPRTMNWYFMFPIACLVSNINSCINNCLLMVHAFTVSLFIVPTSNAIAMSPKLLALSTCWSASFLSSMIMKETPGVFFSKRAGRKKVYVFPVPVAAVDTKFCFGLWRRNSAISTWNQHAGQFHSVWLIALICSAEGVWPSPAWSAGPFMV